MLRVSPLYFDPHVRLQKQAISGDARPGFSGIYQANIIAFKQVVSLISTVYIDIGHFKGLTVASVFLNSSMATGLPRQ